VLGGGLPLAAFAGSRDLMQHLAPLGDVYQAGTLSGNPLATAAGLAVLAQLEAGDYARLEISASLLADGLERTITGAGLPVQVVREATLLGIFFTDAIVRDYDGARAANSSDLYGRFFHAMLECGVALAPGGYEIAFPSLAHSQSDIDRTIDAAGEAASVIVGSG
jgi:glutamate-1-semialdehyde 2,1-aminomutase